MLISHGKTMTPVKEIVYDESKILTLSSLEHIRLRPGMYIGRLGNGSHPSDGIYVLLKEIVDNSIDEFIMGFGKRIDIRIDNGVVNIRDFGRGIDRQLYQKAFKKQGRRVERVCAFEKGQSLKESSINHCRQKCD